MRTDGTLACWGDDTYGQATPPTGTFTHVSAGYGHTCGVRTDGTLACWGWNDAGQASPPEGIFTQVSAGYAHTCAVKTNGLVLCWGLNDNGQAAAPVGGIAEHAQLEPAAASDAHGSSESNALALAGIAAVGALLLAAGAWGMRRRRAG